MKIVYLNDDYPPRSSGGASRVVFLLAKKMKELGHEVLVVTTVRERKNEGEQNENGVCMFRIYSDYNERWRGWMSLYNPETVSKIAAIFYKIKPDVVHAHNVHFHLSYESLRKAKKAGARVFLTAHDVMSFTYTKFTPRERDCGRINYHVSFLQNLAIAQKRFNPFRNFVVRRYLGYCDKIFTVSDALQEALRQNGIKNTETVYNGLDATPASTPFLARGKNGGGGEKKIILLAGRVSHEKGAYILIGVLPEIQKAVSRASLRFVGVSEHERKKFADYAAQFGVEDSLDMTGWIDEAGMDAAYRESHVVVNPSLIFDSFPTTNLEAALNKKPVVATCFGGSKEFVIDGKTGYIVNPYRAEELTAKIIDVLKNPEKAKAFGEAAHERLKKEFSLEKQAKKLLEFYNRPVA